MVTYYLDDKSNDNAYSYNMCESSVGVSIFNLDSTISNK